ncbi:meiotic chromosome segregation protein [Lindgomyces ingoldianus]|uniref:Meiotic chromosome segregation protein n=1 Tax=Lindgomyces ingoldianus TaxID=673940 RepID=A0ACB6QT36_9PLEO|nr:meiotic chromosome segregation protein [Lindgomyces ingoldianus]KAF2469733.1 meiotic chromosome segregation protein [Lindgomyces ingoldianus]
MPMAPNTSDNLPPTAAYFPTSPASPLHPPTALYNRLSSLPQSSLVKTLSLTIPPRSGRAFQVLAGSIFRLSTPDGPQVGDLNIWNAHDPRERFWAARTRQLQGSHVKEGDRLWSCLPFMRPLCGVIRDGCGLGEREEGRTERGGRSRWGGRVHDLLGTRCDPYVSHMLTSTSYDYHCHSNLVRAILPFALTEYDIHDVLNVFQVTGLDSEGRYFMEPSPATPDSFVDFFAEQDLLCALSTCPGGDLSAWGWHQAREAEMGVAREREGNGNGGGGMKSTCRGINVEVWEIEEGVREEVLRDWRRPERSGYMGNHGMTIPSGEA